MIRKLLLFVLLLTCSAGPAWAQQPAAVFFREDFSSLADWSPFYFPKIKRHSTYTIERTGDRSFLKAESHDSASAIVYKKPFNVYEYPFVRWRWKVDNVYAKAEVGTKKGDDYPLRVYIMFEYNPEKAGVWQKLKYGIAKTLYGVYPPESSLNYVWASKNVPERIVTSPYTDRSKMILLQKGSANLGTWQDETVNIVEDYQKAFGTRPPSRARIAIMNDSDNTGESSVSYMEFIEVYR